VGAMGRNESRPGAENRGWSECYRDKLVPASLGKRHKLGDHS
jgi:hypothetical protein